jgi:RecA-family ATPase
VLLAAQYKAGKTTMVANMVKSLADGEPFLGMYRTEPSARITIIDDEMSKGQIRRWYRDHEINNTDHVKIVSLRGALASFDILDPVTRQEWARELHGTEILILDCLRPVLDALGLDENKDGGKFLVAFDALLAETGAAEAIVVHHMGHSGARSRGDSRILDWPDATWNVTREDVENPKSARYFSAHGRDVDEAEKLLEYVENDGRALRIIGGDRRQIQTEDAMARIIDLLTVQPHLTGRAIQTALGGNKKRNDEALARGVREGKIVRYPGPYNGYKYTTKNSVVPVIPSDT